MPSRRGNVNKTGSRGFTSKPDLVSGNLIYPVTITTETVTGGLSLIGNISSPLNQNLFEVQDASGTPLWSVPVAGGPYNLNTDLRA